MPRLNVTSVTASGYVEALKSFSAGTGFRLPQYTSGNRPASAPAVGVMIYRSDTDIIEVWDGSAWQSIVSNAEIESYANDAGRPVSPQIGKLGFNLDTGALEVYNGIDQATNNPIWLTMGGATVEATGGNNTYTFNGYTVHAFTSDGTFTVTKGGDVEVLLVGGGGSGGNDNAAGGGAGGLVFKTIAVTPGAYPIDIGGGGGVVGGEAQGQDGQATTGFGQTALGGGGGGGGDGGQDGRPGGSGGGAAGENEPNNPGTGQQPSSASGGFGNPGGQWGPGDDNTGGGGGGAGAPGGNAGSGANEGGNGGVGRDYSAEFGTTYGENGYFAGGGAGAVGNNDGAPPSSFGNGGLGGGGDHGKNAVPTYHGEPGAANTGGGGGGSAYYGQYGPPGAGGTGIVLVRYLGT